MNVAAKRTIRWRELARQPHLQESVPIWQDTWADLRVYHVGRGHGLPLPEACRRLLPQAVQVAWLEQIHSADVLPAVAGCAGRGDGLIAKRAGLALAIVTADCVPVLLGGGIQVAAVHAGWRGIVRGVVPAALQQLDEPAENLVAWIGPAIGPRTYEVSEEVAARVAAASSETVISRNFGPRPHLDLQAAVAWQLRNQGIERIRCWRLCTHERPHELHSYRRQGADAGRNISLIWRARD